MHDDHGVHDSHGQDAGQNIHIIDEKSVQDKLLSSLAVMATIALFLTGCYWSASPLPAVQAEEENSRRSIGSDSPSRHSIYDSYSPLDANPNGR